jgi:diguanylate cyclase (GGDEF)-like protein
LTVLMVMPAVCLTVQKLVAKVRAQALQLEELSRTDPLTGAANRRGLQHYLGHELIRAAREELTVTVALIDLDHLTKYNKAKGRDAGDKLLRDSVDAWRAELRAGDCIGRYGGEEFAVVLPSCSLEEADGVIERLRTATPASQTCSAGVVEWNGVESAKELIVRAEDALSEAQEAGGNRAVTRVIVADPAPVADAQAIHRLLREINQTSW